MNFILKITLGLSVPKTSKSISYSSSPTVVVSARVVSASVVVVVLLAVVDVVVVLVVIMAFVAISKLAPWTCLRCVLLATFAFFFFPSWFLFYPPPPFPPLFIHPCLLNLVSIVLVRVGH